MRTYSYVNLRYGILVSIDYVCATGHRIHEVFLTIHYDDVVWG